MLISRKYLVFAAHLWCLVQVFGQEELIRNGSFEGQSPFYSRVPTEWLVCDARSTPDIQPISSDMHSHQGDTYLGLVVRVRSQADGSYDGSNEAVHQIFKDSLIAGATYRLTFYLMYDPMHKPSIPLEVGAAKLKISLGDSPCGSFREITTTGLVDHRFWRRYDVPFVAYCQEKVIRLETLVGSENYSLDYIMIDDVSLMMVADGPSDFDCFAEDTEENFFDTDCPLYVPTAFSPNADGLNDQLIVKSSCYLLAYELNIYDRWGNLVFETKDEQHFWDGGQVTEGVYSYQAITEHLDDKGKRVQKLSRGSIRLVK